MENKLFNLKKLKEKEISIDWSTRKITHTSEMVWGNNVVYINKNKNKIEKKLESWIIPINIENKTIGEITQLARKLVKTYENNKMPKNYKDPICAELTGWRFLRNEDGEIVVTNNTIMLVKYAKFIDKADMLELKKEWWED